MNNSAAPIALAMILPFSAHAETSPLFVPVGGFEWQLKQDYQNGVLSKKPASFSYTKNDHEDASYEAKWAVSLDYIFQSTPQFQHEFHLVPYMNRNTATANKVDVRGLGIGYSSTIRTSPSTGLFPDISVRYVDNRKASSAANQSTADLGFFVKDTLIGDYVNYGDARVLSQQRLGLYYDRVNASGTEPEHGYNAGVQAYVDLSVQPFFGKFPAFRIYGDYQIQRDVRATGDRMKDTYKLWHFGIGYQFEGFLSPEIALERVKGDDRLAGEFRQAITQLTLKLKK